MLFFEKSLRMRNVTILLLFTSVNLTVVAQGVFSNKTNVALQKVIEDYPNRFSNIKGGQLSEEAHTIAYESKVNIPGSVNCTLTEYQSKSTAYSWQCNLLETADFEQAKKRFSEIYNQVHNTIIKVEGEKPVILNGKYEVPVEENKYTGIQFNFLPATGIIQHLNVSLTMVLDTSNWKILLQVEEQQGRGALVSEKGK